jgi:hypothetical protein
VVRAGPDTGAQVGLAHEQVVGAGGAARDAGQPAHAWRLRGVLAGVGGPDQVEATRHHEDAALDILSLTTRDEPPGTIVTP